MSKSLLLKPLNADLADSILSNIIKIVKYNSMSLFDNILKALGGEEPQRTESDPELDKFYHLNLESIERLADKGLSIYDTEYRGLAQGILNAYYGGQRRSYKPPEDVEMKIEKLRAELSGYKKRSISIKRGPR